LKVISGRLTKKIQRIIPKLSRFEQYDHVIVIGQLRFNNDDPKGSGEGQESLRGRGVVRGRKVGGVNLLNN